jgi:hypothetical protein
LAGPEVVATGVDGATRFLAGLPRCSAVPTVMTARDAREQPEGTKVAVRGVLLHNPKWDCPAKGCPGKVGADGRRSNGACCNTCRTRWFVVDPEDAARPYMSRARLYLRASGQPQLATLEAQDCDVAKVNAATTPKPVVMRAIDVVVVRGSQALSAQVAAPIEVFETIRPNLESLVASLQVEPLPASAVPPVETQSAPSTAPEGDTPGVTISGQVVDAQSGLAVPGAIVLFLAPGTNVSDVDDDNLTSVAYTTGLADSTGHFMANRTLLRPARYGVMVVADGYRWIGTDEAVDVGEDAPPTLDMGAIPLRHR